MQLNITPQQESIIAEAIRSGQYHDASEVLDDALRVLKVQRLGAKPGARDKQEAIERLRNFGARHGLSLGPGVTVKDLINEGRR